MICKHIAGQFRKLRTFSGALYVMWLHILDFKDIHNLCNISIAKIAWIEKIGQLVLRCTHATDTTIFWVVERIFAIFAICTTRITLYKLCKLCRNLFNDILGSEKSHNLTTIFWIEEIRIFNLGIREELSIFAQNIGHTLGMVSKFITMSSRF